jgi:hypothetical protein
MKAFQYFLSPQAHARHGANWIKEFWAKCTLLTDAITDARKIIHRESEQYAHYGMEVPDDISRWLEKYRDEVINA